jgi:hypothetical protein
MRRSAPASTALLATALRLPGGADARSFGLGSDGPDAGSFDDGHAGYDPGSGGYGY